jgi:DNA-binding XRE family transcriptional regulator
VTARFALGAEIRTLRRHRLSQAELARQVGVSASCLNLIEHYRQPIGVDLHVNIGAILPIDIKASVQRTMVY